MHLLLSATMRLSIFLFFFALQFSFGTPFQQVSSHFSRIPKKIFVPRATPAVSTHSWSRRSISSTSLDTLRWPLCGLEQGRLIQKKVTDISKWRPLLRRLRRWTRRTVVAAALFLAISLTSADPAIARSGIRSGGRMGGSFGAPTRAPVMRSVPRSYPRRSHQPRMIIHRGPQIHLHSPSSSQYSIGDSAVLSRAYAAPARRLTLSDVALVTGVGAVVSLNVIDKLQQRSGNSRGLESPLGPGVSVLSTTLAINVPDRDSPNSILDRLSRLALIARTDTRKGVQDLISETSLEVLRQKDYIISVDSQYSHFSRASDAQREFNQLSIGGRSKFDQETGKRNSMLDIKCSDNLKQANTLMHVARFSIQFWRPS